MRALGSPFPLPSTSSFSLPPSSPCEDTERREMSAGQEEFSPDPDYAGTLISDFPPASRTVRHVCRYV